MVRLVGVLLGLTALGWVLLGAAAPHARAGAATAAPAPNRVDAPVATVAEVVVPKWLEATGVVRPQFEASLGAKVMGRVRSVAVKEGDRVRKGQTVVELDAADLAAAVQVAGANLRSADVGYSSSQTTARMEASVSAARIAEARAALAQSEAALGGAKAKLALAQAGPRSQERTQAALAVRQAEANLKLAESDFQRMKALYQQEAISRRQYDSANAQYEVARAQYDTAKESLSIAAEGTRAEDLRAAQEAVRQAQSAYRVSQASLQQAQASALQADVRRKDVQAAQAQIAQSQAALRLAEANRSYARVTAPFEGEVAARLADPGTMATPGSPLLTVQGGPLRLEAIVPESALASVRMRGTVDVVVDALAGRVLPGIVVEIRPQGDAASHTFLVRVEVPRGQGVLSGMFGRARFAVGSQKQILVPRRAIWERDGLHYAYVVGTGGRAAMRLLTVGEAAGSTVAALSGLSPGERIVLNGREQVKEGDLVEAGR